MGASCDWNENRRDIASGGPDTFDEDVTGGFTEDAVEKTSQHDIASPGSPAPPYEKRICIVYIDSPNDACRNISSVAHPGFDGDTGSGGLFDRIIQKSFFFTVLFDEVVSSRERKLWGDFDDVYDEDPHQSPPCDIDSCVEEPFDGFRIRYRNQERPVLAGCVHRHRLTRSVLYVPLESHSGVQITRGQ